MARVGPQRHRKKKNTATKTQVDKIIYSPLRYSNNRNRKDAKITPCKDTTSLKQNTFVIYYCNTKLHDLLLKTSLLSQLHVILHLHLT